MLFKDVLRQIRDAPEGTSAEELRAIARKAVVHGNRFQAGYRSLDDPRRRPRCTKKVIAGMRVAFILAQLADEEGLGKPFFDAYDYNCVRRAERYFRELEVWKETVRQDETF